MNSEQQTDTVARLWVRHWPAPAAGDAPDGSLRVDTCMRRLCLGVGIPQPPVGDGAERYVGHDAYGFLLEVASGLHSEVPGETNVLGQFRQAWQKYRNTRSAAEVARLAPLVHRLLNDTASIRRDYLQGIGGASYGSLLRKLIRPRRDETLLVVGAGDLARSLLPFFRRQPLGIWNHRPVTIPPANLSRNFAVDDGAAAARWADHVVLTTPPDPLNDRRWSAWLSAGHPLTVTHLGHRRGTGFPAAAGRCFDLDHLFELRRRQENIRYMQLEQARRACWSLAQSKPARARAAISTGLNLAR